MQHKCRVIRQRNPHRAARSDFASILFTKLDRLLSSIVMDFDDLEAGAGFASGLYGCRVGTDCAGGEEEELGFRVLEVEEDFGFRVGWVQRGGDESATTRICQ